MGDRRHRRRRAGHHLPSDRGIRVDGDDQRAGQDLNQPLTTLATAKAASATATIARTSRKASRLTVTWRPATNAKRYVVTVALRRHVKITKSVSAKANRLVVSEALARLGATVSVQAIGPLAVASKAAKVRLAPVKVKRIKHFVL